MKRIVFAVLIGAVVVAGCEKKQEDKPVPVQPEAQTSVVEQVKQSTEMLTEQATAVVDAGAELLKEAGTAAEQAAQEVVETAAGDVAAVSDKVQQQVAEVQVDLQQQGTQLVNGLVSDVAGTKQQGADLLSGVMPVAGSVVGAVTPPETVEIDNAQGKVTLPHAWHGKSYGCPTCHGANTPGPFELGKTTAHTLCKNCHKEKNGPVKCGGCHTK